MAGIYSQGGSAGHHYAGWLETVEAKNFTFGGKVFNGSPSAIYVGSNLVWGSDWLTVAAQKAILGAFGQRDGTAVIKATNAYLNQLAASGQAGKDKATALAGFINEDPMMVCSLGLEVGGVTMPKRWCNSNGTAYIDTGVVFTNNNKKVSADLQVYGDVTNSHIYGSADGSQQWTLNPWWNVSTFTTYVRNAGYNPINPSKNTAYSYINEIVNGVLRTTLNNTTQTSNVSAYNASRSLWLFHCNTPVSGYTISDIGLGIVKIYDGDTLVRHLIPCHDKMQGNGMLDLVNVVFYPNAGTGSFTIPDISYTPSTP